MAAKGMYQKVNHDEESTESLLENQQPIILQPKRRYHRLVQIISPKNWSLKIETIKTRPLTTLVTVLLLLSFSLNVVTWSKSAGGEKIETHEVQYGSDIRYMSMDHKYDHLWNRIGSDHGGLIKYDPDKEWGAPLGVMSMFVLPLTSHSLIPDLDDWFGNVRRDGWLTCEDSRFHQLHCVASLRNALQSAYFGMEVAKDQTENSHWVRFPL